MGKGDQKTKRGKIVRGTYGVKRPRKSARSGVPAIVAKEEKMMPAPKAKKAASAKKKIEEVRAEVKPTPAKEVNAGAKEAVVKEKLAKQEVQAKA